MKENEAICAKPDCDVKFEKRSHNQCYCSKEHQRLETNRKIMLKYYKNKERRAGKVRYCVVCGFTKLSLYNLTDVCSSCESKGDRDRTKEAFDVIARMMSND